MNWHKRTDKEKGIIKYYNDLIDRCWKIECDNTSNEICLYFMNEYVGTFDTLEDAQRYCERGKDEIR